MIRLEFSVNVVSRLQAEINATFERLIFWCGREPSLLGFAPPSGEWSIEQVLEHVSLANHFLLILVEKGRKKAVKKSEGADIERILEHYELSGPRLEQIGVNDSFHWTSPAHMLPPGKKRAPEIKQELEGQRETCVKNLDLMRKGEGVLHKMTMSVNSLGRLDVYQYIYFLLKHAQRHIGQMERIESTYRIG